MPETSLYRAYVGDDLVYVGVSKNALRRVSQHRWNADRIEVDRYPTREAAEAREQQLIEKHRPAWNVTHNPRAQPRRLDKTRHLGTAAALLKAARAMSGQTQGELARAAGTSQQAISAYETGRMEPTLPALLSLVAAAGVELRFDLVPNG